MLITTSPHPFAEFKDYNGFDSKHQKIQIFSKIQRLFLLDVGQFAIVVCNMFTLIKHTVTDDYHKWTLQWLHISSGQQASRSRPQKYCSEPGGPCERTVGQTDAQASDNIGWQLSLSFFKHMFLLLCFLVKK